MSMDLPPPLQDLGPWVQAMVPEVRQCLAALMAPLLPFLGRPRAHLDGLGQEPVGIDNLMRRGSYERLVLSEWLLADEHPEEFLRRAAQAEHLFLRHRLQSPKAQRRLLVMLDAGLSMLGAPRLVQAATFLLLMRRAQQCQASLVFGIAQQPSAWHTATDLSSVRAILAARTSQGLTPVMQQAWSDALSEHAMTMERWWLGADSGADEWLGTWCTHRMLIRPGFDDAVRATQTDRAGQRSLELVVPRTPAMRRLLLGDWQLKSAKVTERSSPRTLTKLKYRPYLFIASDLRDILSTSPDMRVVCRFMLRHRLTDQAAPSVRADTGQLELQRISTNETEPPTAMSISGRTAAIWYVSHTEIRVFGPKSRLRLMRPGQDQLAFHPGQRGLLHSAYLVENSNSRLLLRDRKGRLVAWQPDTSVAGSALSPWRFELLAQEGVVRLDQASSYAAIAISLNDGAWHLVCYRCGSGKALASLAFEGPGTRVTAACYVRELRQWHYAVAVQQVRQAQTGQWSWHIWSGIGGTTQTPKCDVVSMPGQWQILGLARHRTPRGATYKLVAISHDGKTVWELVGVNIFARIYQSASRLTSGTMSVDGSTIALATIEGRLIVLGMRADGSWAEVGRHG